jgi:hypothetical protein
MEQNTKQHNDFILSFAGANIDTTVVMIEEMQLYCEHRNRIAVVGTEKKSYGELDRMNYQLVQNYHKPKIMAVNTKNKPYFDVYTYLLDKFKNGLIIVETDTISDPISDLICKSDKMAVNDIDIMICHNGFEALIPGEVRKANLLRIHANPDINPAVFQLIADFYQDKSMAVIIAQMYANDQYEQLTEYFNRENEKYSKQGLKDYIDYFEYSKQVAYFVYFDVEHNKILNITKEDLEAFMKKMKGTGMLPIPDEEIPVYAEIISI